jgi:signal transduction histidine kinase/ligand-binding sensor domain-containing protein
MWGIVGPAHTRERSVLALSTVLACMLLTCGRCSLALDPSRDISQYAHTAWKIRDGFAKSEIILIAQTPDGYLWLGTESGLLRFDGVRAVPWQPPGGEQLPSNYISGLLVAHDGTLWIGTLKGLASYKDGKVTQYSELAGANVGLFLEDREQTVWFGARQRAIGRLCAMRDRKIDCYGSGTFGVWANPLYEDHQGNLWVISATGLWRWAPGTPERYELARGVTALNALAEDDSGKLLLGTTDGLKQLVGGKMRSYVLPGISANFTPNRFLRSRDGSLWIGTLQGLLHLHPGRVNRFSVIDGLSSDSIDGIFEDREGSVWVATTDGLDRFRDYTIPTISRNQGLSSPTAALVQAASDGSIWTGAADGLNRWAKGVVTFYRGKSALGENRAVDETARSVSRVPSEIANSGLVGTPRSLGRDDEGRLWVGTDKGLFYFERDRFVPVSGVPSGYTFSIAGDGHGGVWILQVENLFHWSPNAAVQQIPWSQFGHKTGRAMLPDRDPRSLWLGFFEGGLVYLTDGKVVRSYGPGVGLGDGRVNHLRFGPNGGLWASTEGGLSRIKDERIATLAQKNGLPCDEVHWSMEDAEHDVWLYMPCGLVRIARSELDAWINDPKYVLKTTVFDNSDGVRSVGVYGSAGPHVTQSPDGRIWFVPKDGLSVINPRDLPFNKLPPPVHIEQVIADHKTYDAPTDSNGQVRIPPRVRDLQIDYTALSLVAPEKVLFRYKLEGWDRDWQDAGTRRQAFYSNLPPRNYRFRVMACNNSGVWNEAGTFLDFSVAPAYYQTWWFRSLCVAAFLVLLAAAYQLRLRQLARQFNMRLEERVSERTRIARELHDTLLQSFQGVLLKFHAVTYVILDRPAEAQKTLETAIEQARQAITEGRDAVQGLRSSSLVSSDIAQAISTFGEELATTPTGQNSPSFRVLVEGVPRDLAPLLRDEIYRITGEALRNAFRHAHAQRIEVEIRYDQWQLRLRVRDDGKGIDPTILNGRGRPGHYGLPGMHERAKLVGGKVAVWSELNSGTEAELTIPASIAYAKSSAARGSTFWGRSA